MAMHALKGARRSGVGKGVARKLRQAGSVPAVYYGRGEEPIALTVGLKELEEVIEKSEGSNVIVDLKVDGEGAPRPRPPRARPLREEPPPAVAAARLSIAVELLG